MDTQTLPAADPELEALKADLRSRGIPAERRVDILVAYVDQRWGDAPTPETLPLPAEVLAPMPTRENPLRLKDRRRLQVWIAAASALEALRGDAFLEGLAVASAQEAGPGQDALSLSDVAAGLLADDEEGEATRDLMPAALQYAELDPERRARQEAVADQMERDGLVAYG